MAEGGKEMIEETNWKQYLTEEVLKEIWHELKIIAGESKCSCGTKYWLPSSYDCSNRTFDNRNDLMDLYEAIFKKGKEEWSRFKLYILRTRHTIETPYIFCFNGKDYEDRCKLVAEFRGYKETKAVLERLKGRKHPEDHPDAELRCCEIDSVKFTDTTKPQIDMASEDREKPVNSQGQRAIDTIDAIASRIKQGFTDYEKVVCIQMLLESYREEKVM
jgi:hypothetical protein